MKTMVSGRKKSGFWAVWVMVALLGTQVLLACGNEATPTPNKKEVDLPKDRALVLSNRDGWPDLYTVDQTGKFVGRLTESAAAEYGAVWSPDGRKIAFTELNGDQATGDYAKNRQVVVMDGDGKNRRVVAPDGFNPVWSPDGQKLMFSRVPISASTPSGVAAPVGRQAANIPAAPPAQINTTPTPTSGVYYGAITIAPGGSLPGNLPLISPGSLSGAPSNPSLTPDPNNTVILDPDEPTPAPGGNNATARATRANLYVVVVDNGQPNLLVNDAVAGVWSPDGKRVAFISGNNVLDQKRTLSIMNADGSERISLSERAKLVDMDVVYVSWSPDGSTLAFTATDLQKNKTSLYRLSPDGSSARRLTDYDGSAREIMSLIWAYADFYNPAPRLHLGPVWSPNNRYLAFTDGTARLSVVDASNANVRYFPTGSATLGQDKDSVLSLSWLPDSRRLLYDRAGAGRNTLQAQAGNYIYDFFDESLEILDTVNKNVTSLLSGPGASLVPACCGMDLLGVGSPPTSGTTPDAASKTSPTAATTSSTLTGKEGKLVYVSGVGQRQLIVQDLKAGTNTVITSGPFKLVDFNLAPKGDRMAYVEVGDRFNATLYLTGLDGKQKRKISEGGGNPDDLSYLASWSPDGRYLAFQALNNDPNLKSGLYVTEVEGANNTPRLITDQDVAAFTWSPDSRQLAFKVNGLTYDLYIAQSDGSRPPQKIASAGRFDNRYSSLGRGLGWSPDGRYLVMSGAGGYGYNSVWQLWLITPQGKIEEQPGYYINRIVTFTPDGSRLIATMASSSQSSSIQAFLMPTNNGPARGWRSYDRGSGPVVSPDGSSLAFFNRAGDNRFDGQFSSAEALNRVVVLNFSNGNTRPTVLDYAPYYAFKARFYTWQPDGKALAFYQNNTIYLTNIQGQQQKPEILARAFSVDRLAWTK